MADIELSPTGTSARTITAKNGDGTARDLTGLTVSIVWRTTDGQPDGGQAAVTVSDAATGLCSYTFDAAAMRLRQGVNYAVRLLTVDGQGAATALGAEGGAPITMRVGEV